VKKNTQMTNWLLGISLMILGGGMTACIGISDIDWKEEVQLSDGQVIIVEREAIYVGGGDEWASNRSLGKIDEYRIRFTSMDGTGKTIEWRSTKKDSQTYPEIPLVLVVADSKPTIFTLIGISGTCDIYSKYVYQNGAWVEEPLPEQFGQRPTNLLFASKRDLPKLLTLTEKIKRNDAVGHRQALKRIGPNRKVCG
jgi:hypothetical protein